MGEGRGGVEGLSQKKKKGPLDIDNSIVITGGEEHIRGLNGNGKNTIKIKLKRRKEERKKEVQIYAIRNHNNNQKNTENFF